MNLMHLKYAIEVAKTSSITKAAENLYMGQPNLSRAIKELEEDLGLEIFKRTSKGITPTPKGEEFLGYARSILAQVDAVEKKYKEDKPIAQSFSISVPRASYISCAFTDFVKTLDENDGIDVAYKETNALRAIRNICEANYKLGIIRYLSSYDKYFKQMLEEKGLKHELVFSFSHKLLISKNSPIAAKETFDEKDLESLVEIAHGDPYVPSVPVNEIRKEELVDNNKHIFVFERGSQLDLLQQLQNSFMWVSPVPQRVLDKYDLIMKKCTTDGKKYVDVLIYKKDYHFSELDSRFIDELMKYKRNLSDI